MNKYIELKIVEAESMNLGEYNKFKGWQIPDDEDPNTEGYLVVCSDEYKTWCPKEQFEKNNRTVENMSFSHALELLKKGFKISRKGWNGKNMYIQFNKARDFEFSELGSFLTIKNVKNTFDTWVPSISDLFAEDWVIFEEVI